MPRNDCFAYRCLFWRGGDYKRAFQTHPSLHNDISGLNKKNCKIVNIYLYVQRKQLMTILFFSQRVQRMPSLQISAMNLVSWTWSSQVPRPTCWWLFFKVRRGPCLVLVKLAIATEAIFSPWIVHNCKDLVISKFSPRSYRPSPCFILW